MQEERIEQREKLYSIRQDFGGRFTQSHNGNSHNYGTAAAGGGRGVFLSEADDLEEDEEQEQIEEEEERQRRQSSLLFDDKSFDTNNLMPD